MREQITIPPKYVAEITLMPKAPCPPGCQPNIRTHDVSFSTREELLRTVEIFERTSLTT